MEDPLATRPLGAPSADRPTQALRPGARPLLPEGGRPRAGSTFGPYRVLALLGRGGMGEVWEAESLDGGHRLALKVLRSGFADAEDRAAFLEEGRLAASVSHPRSVYVYGTGEVAGHPVIAMELVPGGNLSQLVRARGPLPPREAVDLLLQVLEGLQAAAAAGILHRDIKPDNCFLDASGAAKIGDYGLSLRAGAEAGEGFAGTPAYAAPEQVRGGALDARADQYALGATLYHLLTGRAPFEGSEVTGVLRAVLETAPAPPGRLRKGLPPGLERVVLRCLEKDPARRFPDHAALARALRPFSSEAPVPAPAVLRAAAFLVDYLPWSILEMVLERFHPDRVTTVPEAILFLSGLVLAFGLMEGLLGATPGKLLFGLRVAGPGGGVPGLRAGLARAGIWFGLQKLDLLLFLGAGGGGWLARQDLATVLNLLALALLFAPMLRGGGLAGLHERLSGTRTVRRDEAPGPLPAAPALTPIAAGSGRLGPYTVLGVLRPDPSTPLLEALDPRLDRAVWIRTGPPDAPPVPEALRRASRPGCLHWLQGHRGPEGAWDAWEAVPGRALTDLTEGAGWGRARRWLADLAAEWERRCAEGTAPDRLSTGRIWIGDDGRARLLDWEGPGSPAAPEAPAGTWAEVQAFLEGAFTTLRREPWPVHAVALLADLRASRFPEPAALAARLGGDLKRPAALTWRRRLAHLAAPLALPMLFCLLTVSDLPIPAARPEAVLVAAVSLLEQLEQGRAPAALSGRGEDLGRIAADAYRRVVEAPGGPGSLNQRARREYLEKALHQPLRRRAEALAARHPQVAPEELARARAAVSGPFEAALGASLVKLGWVFVVFLAVAALLGLLSSLLFRGGAGFRIAGLAVVGPDGRPVGPGRGLLRGLAAWSPLLAVLAAAGGPGGGVVWRLDLLDRPWTWVGLALLAAGGAWALREPGRGLQDRLAGTRLVPR